MRGVLQFNVADATVTTCHAPHSPTRHSPVASLSIHWASINNNNSKYNKRALCCGVVSYKYVSTHCGKDFSYFSASFCPPSLHTELSFVWILFTTLDESVYLRVCVCEWGFPHFWLFDRQGIFIGLYRIDRPVVCWALSHKYRRSNISFNVRCDFISLEWKLKKYYSYV